ncbi:MAG: SAM-dependent methyltransferase [Desulfobulbaceae bacterium A2]|nr:MAG: SAM-dependent methyltransferase [Desulfobulbaceae bacterium A2]
MHDPDIKKAFVRRKFAAISHRYDLLNSTLSLRIDSWWRWCTVRALRDLPPGPVLDLCAGTLPLSRELARQEPARQVLAVDFCEDMLRQGVLGMGHDRRRERILPVCGDGEEIPVQDASCWACTVAFGVRNLARTERGLSEMQRILKPGGRLLILEFSRPRHPLIRPLYNFYLNRVLPRIAGLLSGDQEAYEYLASSIAAFYEPEELLAMMRRAGFARVSCRRLTFGIVTLYRGDK